MSRTISRNMVVEAYRVARLVFEGRATRADGVATLVASAGFNPSSARDAVENLGHMLRGRVYKRLNNLAMTEHFLAMVLEDYGAAGLRRALAALELHLDYYAGVRTGSAQPAQRVLLARFAAAADGPHDARGDDGLTAGQRAALARAEARLRAEGPFGPSDAEDARRRVLAAVVRRQGQGEFRAGLLVRYGGRCAVSGCGVAAVLEAAHVAPYLGPRTNHPANGLLPRADLHTLFDLGLLSVDASTMTVLVSPALDGTEYEAFRGAGLSVPGDTSGPPDSSALERHRAESVL